MDEEGTAPAEAENIAVCIRVRPMNERETQHSDTQALCCVPSLKVVSLTDLETGAPLSGKGNVFQYDEVFDASSDAHAMYERVGRRIVRSTLGGINGTIFAYGQTSSGKTFTMQGDGGMPFEPEAETSRPGILQLAVEDIFQFIEMCADRDFLLRVSFLEIYNEVVKDLLNPTVNLKLREDPRKGVYVECKEEIITNYGDIVTLLQTGNQNRTVGHTAMNDKSSRSHSVFRIVIESKQKANSRRLSEEDVNGAVLVASLNLVDLAGSESLRHTGAEGIRQREAGNINKSLLTLARVINSLASSGGGGQSAPFRDSKLTRLLQNSLGGNTRTLIICCVTPSDRYIEETKSTLQFAARAKDIKTSATVNEVLDDQTQLRRLKREVHELKKLVNSEALSALKAENEALISEKNHNKTEMARLMGLILSSSSITKASRVSKVRTHRKRMRETWGPGDFPAHMKMLGSLSPNHYPRKRHFPAKENVDPQTLYRVCEDVSDSLTKKEKPVFSAVRELKPKQNDLSDSSRNVIDLFAAVFQSYYDGNCEDPIAAVEVIANEKSASLGDTERARAFDVLADIKSLMVANVQSKRAMEEKIALEQEMKDLRLKLNDESAERNCSKSDGLAEEMKAELVATQEYLAKEKKRCHDLEKEKVNSQQMAAEELDVLRLQLETLKLEFHELQQQSNRENNQLVATVETSQSGLGLLDNEESVDTRSTKDRPESLLAELTASQAILQLAIAERDEKIASLESHGNEVKQTELEARARSLEEENALLQKSISEMRENAVSGNEASSPESEKISQEGRRIADDLENAVVDKLAKELQNIMQELAQLQSDHERTALEKEELQAEAERMSEEIEVSQRQACEMSETLMEKEHIAKVLQAQLDAKLMTISQMHTKHDDKVERLQQSIQDLTIEKEELLTKIEELESTARDEADSKKPATDSCEMDKAHKLHPEMKRMAGLLSAVESELADPKASLRPTERSCEESELKIAFEQSKADSCNSQQESNRLSTTSMDKQEQIVEMRVPDDQKTGSPDRSEQRYNALKEDFKRVTDDLENVSRERDECVEELRALESQLMLVSDEKMKFAIAADEQELKLREMQQAVLSSTAKITTLQAQLEDTQSAKAILEASKTKLEQNVEDLQVAWTTLKANHAAIVEQTRHGERGFNSEDECSAKKIEHLQQRLEIESAQREKLQLDVQSYEETLSMLRKEAKDSSDTIADLSEKMRALETDLDSAARAQEKKDKELSNLTNALARSEEEQQEMRLQSKQRLVAAEGKEMALQDKIIALEQQLKMTSTDMAMVSAPLQKNLELELDETRAKQTELQSKVTTLENQLADAKQELVKQIEEWESKQTVAKAEIICLTTEKTQFHDEISTLQADVEASEHTKDVQARELLKARTSCTELLQHKEAVQRELEAANAIWERKERDLMRQMDTVREQFREAQAVLEEYRKNADEEIHQLRCVVKQSEAEIEKLKRSAKAMEEDWDIRSSEQEDWQKQANRRQEMLQTKCNELNEERRLLKEKCAAIEAQRRSAEEQLQGEIYELQRKHAAAQTQQANYQAKLKEMEAQLEIAETEGTQNRNELKNLAGSLRSAQMEAVNYHDKLVETQLACKSMEELVEKQKARIEKLDKVKMTTETLELFRNLKKSRLDLQAKVQDLQKDLAQAKEASSRSQEDQLERQWCVVRRKEEELKRLKDQVEELREAVRFGKRQAQDDKAKMRAALDDEREKAEHEIQEMQALVKEKMELVEKLESQVASVKDAMTKLREQNGENVSYLEKENLELHVENRELKKQLESTVSLSEKDEVTVETSTYDASAAAAAKVLGEDCSSINKESEVAVDVDDSKAAIEISSFAQKKTGAGTTKAGGFLLSTTEMDAIAADSQEDPKAGEQPECSQQ